MLHHVALAEEIRQTSILIEHDPHVVSLNRKAPLVDDGEGGRTRSGVPTVLPAQRFYIGGFAENFGVRNRPAYEEDERGERLVARFILVGMPGTDIAEGDWFELGGHTYTVQFVDPLREFQVKAEAVRVTNGG